MRAGARRGREQVHLASGLHGGRSRHAAGDGQQERLHLRAEARACPESGRELDERRDLHEGVVSDARPRGVAAPSVDADPERRASSSRRSRAHGNAAAEDEPVAGAFVHAVVRANRLGMLLAEPLGQETGRPPRRRRRRRSGRRGIEALAGGDAIATALAATCPFLSSAPLQICPSRRSRIQVGLPLSGIREHGVRVGQEHEPRPGAAAGDPCDEVRPFRHLRVQLGLDSVVAEVLAQETRRARLVPGRG